MNPPPPQIAVLATDLDGTLIPLEEHPQNFSDLQFLCEKINHSGLKLVYVTGRHQASVEDAIRTFQLPCPDWLICDVGTTLLRATGGTQKFEIVTEYREHLNSKVNALPQAELEQTLRSVPQLRRQESEKQGEFKLSYYTQRSDLEQASTQIKQVLRQLRAPYSVISSVDPFNGEGLIDLLPQGVSKAYALQWWGKWINQHFDSILFAGDSGNDLAALTAGFRAIVVKNASSELVDQICQYHQQRGWSDRLFLASQPATSGVLEGLHFYLGSGRLFI